MRAGGEEEGGDKSQEGRRERLSPRPVHIRGVVGDRTDHDLVD